MQTEELDPKVERQLYQFNYLYNHKQIKATWGLSLVIVAMFLLEEFFGGSTSIPVLMRMGANVSMRVHEGEYYRLFSSVFLHAGIMHVFFNTYVLFALGGFFNRILGELRYLLIFFVSGVAGSLSSLYFGKSHISVGASGAIWGLFGASLVLSLFKTPFLPEPIRVRLLRITLINVAINVAVSFLPMIDFWAHIGGGIAGFLVSLPLVFGPRYGWVYHFRIFMVKVLVVIFAIAYALSIGAVIWRYKPWQDEFKGSFRKVGLNEVGFSLSMPQKLAEHAGPENNKDSAYYVFGSPELDQLVIEIHFFHHELLGTKPDENWLLEQRKSLLDEASVPKEIKKSIYLRETPMGSLLYYQQPTKNPEITMHNYVVVRQKYVVKFSCIGSTDLAQTKVDELALSILASLKPKEENSPVSDKE